MVEVTSKFEHIENMAAKAAIKNMFEKRYFDICVIDSLLKMLNRRPNRRSYNVLYTLHCVEFEDMEAELLASLPELINDCLNTVSLRGLSGQVTIENLDTRALAGQVCLDIKPEA